MTVEIEVSEIRNRFGRTVGGHLTLTYETAEALSHLDVHEMWRVQFVLISKKTGLYPGTQRCLQKELQ